MYNKILVPLDGSPFSESSLDDLKIIAKGLAVPKVILIRVMESLDLMTEQTEGSVHGARERAMEKIKTYLTATIAQLGKDGVKAEMVVVEGKADDQILSYAEKNGVDLIIMSTHGHSGPSRFLLGSVSSRIVTHACMPVLTVPPKGCRVS
jgi:nucleotide-binding universal stress UspA family protein